MSIFPKLFLNLLAANKVIAVLPVWLTNFIARVTPLGGTLHAQTHTLATYNNTSPYSPTVIQPCDTGKPTVLYNIEPASPDFTVSRIDAKYVLSTNSKITSYAIDDPAIELNPDGTYKGLLVEQASTNWALQSEDLDNGTYWSVVNASIAASTQTDPKGGTNSFLLAESTNISLHAFLTETAHRPSMGAGQYWTQSVYLKKGTGVFAPDIVQLTFGTSTHSATQHANFNISTGTVLTTSGGTADIRDMGNGWYRCSWTSPVTAIGSGTAPGILAVVFTDNNDSLGRAPSYEGDTNADVFIWGAQLEETRTATSYIPTTTTSENRVKDEIELTGASTLIGQSEGTLYVEVDWKTVSGTIQYLLDVSNGSTGSRVLIYNFNGILRMYAKATTTGDLFNQGVPSTAFTGVQRFAFAYKTNDFELYRNGSSVSTNTSGSLATLVLNQINIGTDYIGAYQSNMWIRSVALYDTRLSAADMEALTKGDGYFFGVNEDVFETSNVTFSER